VNRNLSDATALLCAIVIAKNEESNIADCLRSVDFAQERVVVDSASTDQTVRIAESMGAVVAQFDDWPGFGPQKNRALDLASGQWVLSLDADERVSPVLAQEILQVLRQAQEDAEAVAFAIPRLTQFCGVWIRHCGWTPDYVLRLFKRGEARFSDDLVHEKLLLNNVNIRVIRLKNPLLHFSYASPEQYWRKLQQYSSAWAAQKYAQGKSTTMVHAALSALVAFVRSYVFRLGFLDGAMGFAVCTMQAQAAFGKYFELYYLNRQDAK
jgi:glycosyltransferase involved in cell wall biosynthesis